MRYEKVVLVLGQHEIFLFFFFDFFPKPTYEKGIYKAKQLEQEPPEQGRLERQRLCLDAPPWAVLYGLLPPALQRPLPRPRSATNEKIRGWSVVLKSITEQVSAGERERLPPSSHPCCLAAADKEDPRRRSRPRPCMPRVWRAPRRRSTPTTRRRCRPFATDLLPRLDTGCLATPTTRPR